MGLRPSNRHSLGRIDNDKDYCPENCRWELPEEQANNKTNNIFIKYGGKTQTLAQWSRELGIEYQLLKRRYHDNWSIEKMFNFKKEKVWQLSDGSLTQ